MGTIDNSSNAKDMVEIDHEAFGKLYNETNQMAYYTALSILKSETDAQDILQTSYIAAYTKLNQLKDASLFVPWLKLIVINNCKNILKSRKPNLFLIETEEENILDSVEERNEDFFPEDYIIKEVKRKQIMDIIERLPELQRTTILLYYYNELSVKEIADVMECSESTVTSKISYAKKFIKREVEMLEKRGDKIYTAMPIPFLTKLFIEDANSRALTPNDAKEIWNHIAKSAPALLGGASQVFTAVAKEKLSKIAAKIEGLSVPAKCAIAGTLVVAVTIATVASIAHPTKTDASGGQVTASYSNQGEIAPATQNPMRQSLSEDQAAAYYDALTKATGNYGYYTATTTLGECSAIDNKTWLNSNGVAYAQLIDFDGDGAQELYFYYLEPKEKNGDSPRLTHEVWSWDGTKAVQVYKELTMSNGFRDRSGNSFYFATVEGTTYIMRSGRNMFSTGGGSADQKIPQGECNYVVSAIGFSNGKFTEKAKLSIVVNVYTKIDDVYTYSIMESVNVTNSNRFSQNGIYSIYTSEDTQKQFEVDPQEVRLWKERFKVKTGEENLLIRGGIYIKLGWISNDVK